MIKDIKTLKITLRTLEPFRIGAKQNIMSAADNPVTSIGGRVVIQGTSLKGALRASIEEYLISKYPRTEALKPCIPSAPNTLSADEKGLIQKKKYRDRGGCSYSPDPRKKSESICPACYLLGSQGLMGFVRVPYLFTDKTPEELYAVRIDRATGVVSEKTNRDFEIMADGVEFTGNIEIVVKDPTKDWELGKSRILDKKLAIGANDEWLNSGEWNAERIIKELIVERLEGISIIGGFKSKGCGKVKIEVHELK